MLGACFAAGVVPTGVSCCLKVVDDDITQNLLIQVQRSGIWQGMWRLLGVAQRGRDAALGASLKPNAMLRKCCYDIHMSVFAYNDLHTLHTSHYGHSATTDFPTTRSTHG